MEIARAYTTCRIIADERLVLSPAIGEVWTILGVLCSIHSEVSHCIVHRRAGERVKIMSCGAIRSVPRIVEVLYSIIVSDYVACETIANGLTWPVDELALNGAGLVGEEFHGQLIPGVHGQD